MLPKELQDAIKKLPAESQYLFEAVVVFFEQKIEAQEQLIRIQEVRIKKLEDQISKNSKNSSKPVISAQTAEIAHGKSHNQLVYSD